MMKPLCTATGLCCGADASFGCGPAASPTMWRVKDDPMIPDGAIKRHFEPLSGHEVPAPAISSAEGDALAFAAAILNGSA